MPEAVPVTSIEAPLAAAARLARDFALSAAEHDRDATFPGPNFAALHRAGLLGLNVPRALGGLGGGLSEAIEVVQAIGRAEPSTALVLALHYAMHASIARMERCSTGLRERLAREAATELALINALRVEPELGTPARGGLPATRARHIDAGWRISGHKIYASGAPLLRWALVWAVTDEPDPRVGHFLVPMDAPGVRIEPAWNHLGMRASGSHDVVLADVVIPDAHAVDIRSPQEWGAPSALDAVWFSIPISAVYDGIARAALDWLVTWLAQRKPSNLGAPLATLPRFQETVGEMRVLLDVNRRLLESIAAQTDRTPAALRATDGGIVKYTVTTNSIRAVELALAVTGNAGLSRTNPLERHYRDVLCSRVHTPQNDSVLLGAGREALGL